MRLDATTIKERLGGAAPASGLAALVKGPVAGAGGGDDWLSRVNETIANFRDLMAAAKAGGLNLTGAQGGGNTGGELLGLAKLLIQQGYGDTPLGTLAKSIERFTLKQLEELARGNRAGR